MIELGHIGVGALLGARMGGPLEALIAGIVSHGVMDVAPHGEIHDVAWEEASTAVGLVLLASRYGLRSPVTWAAIGSVLPDAEHVLPSRLRPTTPIFPTHRYGWTHAETRALAIPAWAQVLLGGAVIGGMLMHRRGER